MSRWSLIATMACPLILRYFDVEEQLMNQETVTSSKICELLGSSAGGTAKDQMRLFLIYMIEGKPKKDDLDKCQKLLTEKCDDAQMGKSRPVASVLLAFTNRLLVCHGSLLVGMISDAEGC